MAELRIKEHFQVPEGYFDNLTEQVMKALPEQEFQPMKVGRKRRVIPMWSRYAAAACVVGVVMISAFTAFYPGSEKTAQQQSQLAAVTTIDADTSKNNVETVVGEPADAKPAVAESVKEKPLLAKAETHVTAAAVAVKAEQSSENSSGYSSQQKQKTIKSKGSSHRQSYDMDVNTGYDQHDMERAAMYMGIDHHTVCEMMYEDL